MKINQIKAGAMLSYVSMGLSTIISLVYTPIMLQRLGESEFGVYQAVLLAVFVHPTTYWGLIPPGCAFVAVYGLSVWLFGLNRYERGLVTGPLRRLTRRRKRGGGRRAP